MGYVFWIFGHISGYLAILALAMSIASGLYMLSDLAEEYPTMAGRLLKYGVLLMALLHLVLWVDALPLYESAFGLFTCAVYGYTLTTFPFVQMFSVRTISAVIMFLASNIVWLRYFLGTRGHHVLSIFGFFVVMVWALPCGLFVSLIVVTENNLPTSTIAASSGGALGQNGQPMGAGGDILGSGTVSGIGGSAGKKQSVIRNVFASGWSLIEDTNSKTGIFTALRILSDKRK